MKKGYTCLTNMAYGQDLVWQYQETPDSEVWPDIYETELECRKEMIDEVVLHLEQFIAGDREYDEIVWPENEYEVVSIEIDQNDVIWCWNEQGNEVYVKSLKDWREGL